MSSASKMRPLASTHSFFVLLSFFCVSVHSIQYLTTDTAPSNISAACSNALITDISCGKLLSFLNVGKYYTEEILEPFCTTDCSTALAKYQASVTAVCDGQTWEGYSDDSEDDRLPVHIIPDVLRYLYNLTCLVDDGRYCSAVALDRAQSMDKDNSTSTASGSKPSSDIDGCDLCFIKNLRLQAEAPYFDGPDLASVYSSKTSSCGVTGYPLTTSTLALPTAPSPTTTSAVPTCTGTTYTIQSGDTCQSISESQSIGTDWLLNDNSLKAFCHNFPSSGTLCLSNTCRTYTVRANDTCSGIASSNNITTAQLRSWNPSINVGCNNIDTWVGYQICVEKPGSPFVPATTSFSAVTSASVAVAIPTNVAEGTNSKCAKYYTPVQGDYCNMVILKFAISLPDFLILNPEINANCTNLYADEAYCVQPVGDINDYPGASGYVSAEVTATKSIKHYSVFPSATGSWTSTRAIATSTSLPFAKGTREDCQVYLNGADSQIDTSVFFGESACEIIADIRGISLEDLGFWNPSLNTTSSDCAFQPGYWYCGSWGTPSGSDDSDTATEEDLPLRDGTTSDCTWYTDATDGVTCMGILDAYELTIDQFYKWNTDVKSDCSGLWLGYRYCVEGPGYVKPTAAASTSSTATSIASGTPGPTQSGIAKNCNKYLMANAGGSCSVFASRAGITLSQLYAWNSVLGSNGENCNSQFWGEEYYCVGVSSATTSSSMTSKATASTSTKAAAPGPTQSGIISSCNNYLMANNGGSCTAFASRAGISLSQLYAWNTVLGANGENCNTQFWGEEYYCVGVSSAATSTSTSTKAASSTSTKAAAPGPTQSGIISSCNRYLMANNGGSCTAFASRAGISLSQLYAWNTILGSNGENCNTQFWGEEYYCVGISAATTPTSTQKPTSTKATAPGPTQSGITANCNKYLMANPGGDCVTFAGRAGISTAQLYQWNSVLGSRGENCNAQFWGNEYYCVGVSG